ncbi:MAG: hypothetical protein IIB81_05020, partial [Nanoarchaeota archaeon]|nr:hypothetical protein [Nanoarchaeota archaeon]
PRLARYGLFPQYDGGFDDGCEERMKPFRERDKYNKELSDKLNPLFPPF